MAVPANRAQTLDYVRQMMIELARMLADAGVPDHAQQLIDLVRTWRDGR